MATDWLVLGEPVLSLRPSDTASPGAAEIVIELNIRRRGAQQPERVDLLLTVAAASSLHAALHGWFGESIG